MCATKSSSAMCPSGETIDRTMTASPPWKQACRHAGTARGVPPARRRHPQHVEEGGERRGHLREGARAMSPAWAMTSARARTTPPDTARRPRPRLAQPPGLRERVVGS
jgi:hypothetical protein